ncbi:hypothetical protein [Microbacterium oleivorans]|uniref:Lipoprotein n=1 Tax=Microbacterium oleivorans TaxID=273677 RepID=A0A177K8Y3_9MICO|nr:hypothetical protein [Microbacterium oleivorans]OAH49859.1 hypothetical protein AYL44_09790 [Microbacterium oleivorans]
MSLRRTALPVLAVIALLLTACAPTEFAREQTAGDRPDSVVDGADGAIDVTTLRYVGQADDYDVYLARAADDSESLCLSLAIDDAWQTTECARDYVSVPISDSASVAADLSYRGGEDRDMISDNVWVNRK